MENDADMIAAYLSVLTMVRQVGEDRESLPRGFLRMAYATTSLLALMDQRRISPMSSARHRTMRIR